MHAPHLHSGGRYPVLRAFAIIYMLMAVVALLGGFVVAGWAMFASPWNNTDRIVLALVALAVSFFVIVGNLAVAEIIKLFMDIEHNTRMAALNLMGKSPVAANDDGGKKSRRISELDEETAEGALIRGH